MGMALREPDYDLTDPKELLLGYLDAYRAAVEAKLSGLRPEEMRRSRLPSGWTPLELLKHLVYMERRWMHWRFAAEDVDSPWGDSGGDPDGPWSVDPADTTADLIAHLHSVGARTREIVDRAALTDLGAVGGGFTGTPTPPTLAWILVHVLQEYARHTGHLDIARELADGVVGK